MEFEVVDRFVHMLEDGFFPNDYCFVVVARACLVPENASIGHTVFGFIINSGYLDSDVCVGCALIDMFAKGSTDLVAARKVFEKMPERNVVAWTLMMTRCTQLGSPKKAVDLFLDMLLAVVVAVEITGGPAIDFVPRRKQYEIFSLVFSEGLGTYKLNLAKIDEEKRTREKVLTLSSRSDFASFTGDWHRKVLLMAEKRLAHLLKEKTHLASKACSARGACC
ncbi:pentatricopeptide repeat-containing protein At3g49170, chloroplastic-like [Eucalyptus grandis]|uniref:pentatricopeptide repeat-containing protein At3g49170, chloroplastic-like n=1 Tax=Eucalyptus grandis TaxID=71139 RepID=UPI000524BA4B|nr:pentatricopeptide repeat-containing protein At3g49170, chloroplastic-like [Eucalyptus grandis]